MVIFDMQRGDLYVYIGSMTFYHCTIVNGAVNSKRGVKISPGDVLLASGRRENFPGADIPVMITTNGQFATVGELYLKKIKDAPKR